MLNARAVSHLLPASIRHAGYPNLLEGRHRVQTGESVLRCTRATLTLRQCGQGSRFTMSPGSILRTYHNTGHPPTVFATTQLDVRGVIEIEDPRNPYPQSVLFAASAGAGAGAGPRYLILGEIYSLSGGFLVEKNVTLAVGTLRLGSGFAQTAGSRIDVLDTFFCAYDSVSDPGRGVLAAGLPELEPHAWFACLQFFSGTGVTRLLGTVVALNSGGSRNIIVQQGHHLIFNCSAADVDIYVSILDSTVSNLVGLPLPVFRSLRTAGARCSCSVRVRCHRASCT